LSPDILQIPEIKKKKVITTLTNIEASNKNLKMPQRKDYQKSLLSTTLIQY